MDIAVNSEVNNKKEDGTAIDMSRKIALHNYPLIKVKAIKFFFTR